MYSVSFSLSNPNRIFAPSPNMDNKLIFHTTHRFKMALSTDTKYASSNTDWYVLATFFAPSPSFPPNFLVVLVEIYTNLSHSWWANSLLYWIMNGFIVYHNNDIQVFDYYDDSWCCVNSKTSTYEDVWCLCVYIEVQQVGRDNDIP